MGIFFFQDINYMPDLQGVNVLKMDWMIFKFNNELHMPAVYQIKIWYIPSAYSVYTLFSYNYSIDNKETVSRYWIYSCMRVIAVRGFFPSMLHCFSFKYHQ